MELKEKIQKIRCILFDLDGTLMHAHPTFITPYAASVLNRLQDKGYRVGFCTGRALTSLAFLTTPVGLRTNMMSIGCSGAEIGPAAVPPGQAFFRRPFPTGTLLDMLSEALKNGLNFSLDAHGTLYLSEHLDYAETYIGNYHKACELGVWFPKPEFLTPETLEKAADGTVLKPMLWYREPGEFHRMDRWFAAHPELHTQSSGFNLVEVQTNDVSKATALHMLMEEMGMTTEECCVFGDSENDLPVLKAAGLSVAMCNGFPSAIEIADLITDEGNNEDGAAKFAEKLFLEDQIIL